VAEKRLGMHVIHFDKDISSMEKGESLYDTVKTLSSIGVEVVVIRHWQATAMDHLVKQDIGCAVINAGAGTKAHPTQALLDLYTIHKHFGRLEGLQVAIVGDIVHSRVARSTLSLLKKCGVEVVLSGPTFMSDSNLCDEVPFLSLEEVLPKVDVVMLLRVQFERHEKEGLIEPKNYLHRYGLTAERFNQMKADAVIMHPGPVNKGIEIASELVEHPRSKIFEQMANGVFVRMAALEYALGGVVI
jgi:aspartate carbamoyltransferase catalytic subunit